MEESQTKSVIKSIPNASKTDNKEKTETQQSLQNTKAASVTNNHSESNYTIFDYESYYSLSRAPYKTNWITSERLNDLRKRVQEAVKGKHFFLVLKL